MPAHSSQKPRIDWKYQFQQYGLAFIIVFTVLVMYLVRKK
jgi:hypothetical protein